MSQCSYGRMVIIFENSKVSKKEAFFKIVYCDITSIVHLNIEHFTKKDQVKTFYKSGDSCGD